MFHSMMEERAKHRKSNIILALDFPIRESKNSHNLFSRAKNVLKAACPYICAVKFNRHLVLPLGLFDGVQELVEEAHKMGVMAIMDCKINDIGATNRTIAENYYAAGFDSLTANPFIGWEDGVEPVFNVAQRLRRGVILLVYMSHKGAFEGYGQTVYDSRKRRKIQQYRLFTERAIEWGADGVVVGATYPEKISEVYGILHERIPIYSPGIGSQGGKIQSALDAGARYLIVGRSITLAKKHAEAAREIRDLAILKEDTLRTG